MSRKKGSTGSPLQMHRNTMYLNSTLQKMVPIKTERQKQKTKGKGHGKPPLMSDSEFLQARGDYEFRGVPDETLAKRYGVELSYMRINVLDYRSKSFLVPKISDFR